MASGSKILVVGSSNTDMVIMTDHFPRPGETIIGGKFLMNPGGKGANQAVAAARRGGLVSFISRVGNDIFGKQTIRNLLNEGIDVSAIITDPDESSGVAMITVDRNAENSIVVAPGANMNVGREVIDLHFTSGNDYGIWRLQREIPLDTIIYTAMKAFKKKVRVILNPAPATSLPDDLYASLYLITPNESETEFLTGIRPSDQAGREAAAAFFKSKGVRNVIITLGAAGAYLDSGNIKKVIPAPVVKAVDTTAAGDTFNGAVAVALSGGKDLENAVIFANRAASISVTRMGAQSSVPFLNEIIEEE